MISLNLNQRILLFLALSCQNTTLDVSSLKPRQLQSKNAPSQQQGTENKIVGGVEVIPGRYPYMVGLWNHIGFQLCGGTLIHPQWVLTSASCSDLGPVAIGRHNISDSNETYESIDVEFETVHPNYREFTREYDFMLLRLKTHSNFSTVTLDDGSTIITEGSNVTVMGWGGIESNWFNDVLEEVELEIMDNAACQTAYSSADTDDYDLDEITETMVCATGQGMGFHGDDRGGPLIIKDNDAASDIQIGIASFKQMGVNPGFPSVFTRLSEGIEFINTILECSIPNDTNFDDCCSVQCIDDVFTCVNFPLDGFDYSNCSSRPCSVGNGFCDSFWSKNNVAECNYDGGDCCRDTCSGERCERNFFCCQDPEHRDIRDVFSEFFVRIFFVFLNLAWKIRLLIIYILDMIP